MTRVKPRKSQKTYRYLFLSTLCFSLFVLPAGLLWWNEEEYVQTSLTKIQQQQMEFISMHHQEPPKLEKKVIDSEKHPNDNLLVGLMVSDVPRYMKSMQAQADTWIHDHIPPQRVFVVRGNDPNLYQRTSNNINVPRFVQSPCIDRELYCKRMMHVIEAHHLLTKDHLGFDWLLSGNEDWYVNIPDLQTFLREKDPETAMVYAYLGCGDADLLTIHNPNHTCPKINHGGGICGGAGIVFSRKAVEIMMRDGEEALWRLTRNQPFNFVAGHPQDDPVLACVIHDYNGEIGLELPPWELSGYFELPGTCPGKDCHITVFHSLIVGNLTAADHMTKVHQIVSESRKMQTQE